MKRKTLCFNLSSPFPPHVCPNIMVLNLNLVVRSYSFFACISTSNQVRKKSRQRNCLDRETFTHRVCSSSLRCSLFVNRPTNMRNYTADTAGYFIPNGYSGQSLCITNVKKISSKHGPLCMCSFTDVTRNCFT